MLNLPRESHYTWIALVTHACLFISMCPTRMISVQVIVSQEHYDKLPEAEEAEEDMLDLASCLTSTSRLGCQILLSKELEGMEVQSPVIPPVHTPHVFPYMYIW